MQIIKGAYGGRQTVIGYLRMCRLMKKRELAAFRSAQKERLFSAIEIATEEIGTMKKNAEDSVGEEHGEIFGVYLTILSSESLSRRLLEQIDLGDSPEDAIGVLLSDSTAPLNGEFSLCHIREALDILGRALEEVDSPVAVEKKGDSPESGSFIYVSDGEGIIPLLNGLSKKEARKSNLSGLVCLTAAELTAALSLDIPAILIDSRSLPGDEWEGVTAILDCRRKRLVLDPDLGELEQYSLQGREIERRAEELSKLTDILSVTMSGRRIFLGGELHGDESISEHYLSGGDPKALIVTDGDCLNCTPSEFEEEQYSLFKRLATSDLDATVRLIGSAEAETCELILNNGSLGLRGSGLFALFRSSYKAQLRALLRATAHGDLSILLPDVCCEGELWQFRSIFREARNELKEEGLPFGEPLLLGVELSTPSALIGARVLSDGARLVVIDLDRLACLMSGVELNDPIAEEQLRLGLPSTLELCAKTLDGLRAEGRRFGVRGSLAADPELTHSLIECGFECFFLPSENIPTAKEKVLSFGGR